MGLLACFVFTLLLVKFCEAKSVRFKGYPEGIVSEMFINFFFNFFTAVVLNCIINPIFFYIKLESF